ncbi:hypothetical protein ONS95_002014 [Cadophora gregata]|uniref:uncharacterized protein n=1 Tax=Cadophora gregata TaxID=51156 RepID=UPI0026DBF443|nr:uncharacterized protein ONS95_002014 [Cadophora gregata]KAK0111669.1 hypothetical protein ONS95_002014 [Cadophora gregata]KAK0111854.1 hypothetical protein ONS96_001122 [Cadophora gregata f. sp. sojae]
MDAPKPPPYRGAQTTMMAISIVFTTLGTVAIILRLVGRWIVLRKFGVDDITMTVGMVLTGGYLFEILYGRRFGLGLHGADIAFERMHNVLMLIYAIQLTYNTIIALVKISIVSFYLRLATVDSALRKGSWATIIFLLAFYITTQTTTTLQCLPIHSNWDLTGTVKKKCINTVVYFYIIAVVNILLDIWILLLPVRTLSNIKRSRRDKIVLLIIFGVGGFSCISSIIRLYTIKVFATSKDPFFDGVPINTWSMIEINVAVVCASVPAMKPLFTKAVRERMTGSSRTRTAFNSYGHQMLPLSGEENKSPSGGFRDAKSGYMAKATSKGMGGSEEHINSKIQGIEYEREFTVEESYIGSTNKSISGSSSRA